MPGVTADEHRLENGIVTVEVDPTDGTFSVDGHRGLGQLVDGGDVGDTYNWCPPDADVVVDAPRAVSTRVVEAGPVSGGRREVRKGLSGGESIVLDPPQGLSDGAKLNVVTK